MSSENTFNKPVSPVFLSDNDKFYSAVYASEKVLEHIYATPSRSTCNYIETSIGSGTVLLNVLKNIFSSRCKNILKLHLIINDPDSYITSLYETLLSTSASIERIRSILKLLCSKFNSQKTVEAKENYLKQLCVSMSTITEKSPAEIRLMKGLMFAFVMYFTKTHKSKTDINTRIVNAFVRLNNVSADDIINISAVEILKKVLDKRLQKEHNVKITFEITNKSVRNCITSTVPTSPSTNTVVYMNPPYMDNVRRYNTPNEEAIGEHSWSAMYLTEYYAKIKRKIPSVICINDTHYSTNRLKYKQILKFKKVKRNKNNENIVDRRFIMNSTRKTDAIFSNKSLGREQEVSVKVYM